MERKDSVLEQDATMDILGELKSIRVISCGKAHEATETYMKFYECPRWSNNAACGHLFEYDSPVQIVLRRAGTLAFSLGRQTEEDRQAKEAKLSELYHALHGLDSQAADYYHMLRLNGDDGLTEITVQQIRAQETALGKQVLAIRDELVGLLEIVIQ
ncbi:MAG: hypothetical protein AAB383_04865 [Patescibacteria group bacterium]